MIIKKKRIIIIVMIIVMREKIELIVKFKKKERKRFGVIYEI